MAITFRVAYLAPPIGFDRWEDFNTTVRVRVLSEPFAALTTVARERPGVVADGFVLEFPHGRHIHTQGS